MLGYRTFFTVDARRHQVVEQALAQLHSWLKYKQYAADNIQFGAVSALGEGVEGTLLESSQLDGARSVRARVVENKSTGRWTTQLTVHVPGRRGRSPWIWLDVDSPELPGDEETSRARRWTGTPKLARYLLEVFQASDGQARLGPSPRQATETQTDKLLDIVCDPDRRGLVFLAGTDVRLPVPPWTGLVENMLKDTVGLAGAYVLTSQATKQFNALIGDTHAVAAGTVRTFLPSADPADPLDALKHRILTTERILRDDGKNVRRLLGWKAREATIAAPLPHAAVRIDREFERAIDELLVARLTVSSAATTVVGGSAADDSAEPARRSLDLSETIGTWITDSSVAPEVDETESTRTPERSVASQVEAYTALSAVLVEVTGFMELNLDTVAELGRLARAGLSAESAQAALARRLRELQDRNQDLANSRDEVTRLLDDEQLDRYEAETGRAKAENLVKNLRNLLSNHGQAVEAWSEEHTQFDDDRPSSFDDLLHRLIALNFVVFTGNADQTLELDEHDPLGNWARKTWEIVSALEDYAAASEDGRFRGSVDGYLRDLPGGCRGFSVSRHARDESETVRKNTRLRRFRILPVPREVIRDGTVFMGAHFKITQSATVSPRLHYYDDTGRSGKVYVGYIGRHLPTAQSA